MARNRLLGAQRREFPRERGARASSCEAGQRPHDLVETVPKGRIRRPHVAQGHTGVDASPDLES